MKGKKIIGFIFMIVLLCTTIEARKNKGNVRYANNQVKTGKIYRHPEWMDNFAMFCDYMFDWMGYHEIPHTMRYSFVLLLLAMPVWAAFFYYCCVHNDEYEDPLEESEFKKRVEKVYKRKQARLKKAKEMKWD